MLVIALLLSSILALGLGYRFYGGFLARRLGLRDSEDVPAHRQRDGIDHVPASRPVLFGHHFATIAGAGPIVGPIIASQYGWLPALIWIIIGSIFIGAVHDFTALVASIRHRGTSIGGLIERYVGGTGKRLFLLFAFAALALVVAVFTSLVQKLFTGPAGGAVAMASILFMLVALGFGLLRRLGVGLLPATVLGLLAMAGVIALSLEVGLSIPGEHAIAIWGVIILAYCFIAAVTPVGVLLQPRDYLNSFLLVAILLGGLAGVVLSGVVGRAEVALPAWNGFGQTAGPLFPFLFILIACGAVSGFHSIVSSGTTAKQLSNERDARPIGYGAMLVESLLAVLALITIMVAGSMQGGALGTFAGGLGALMHNGFGLPAALGATLVGLAVGAFALTSLDSCTRLARFLLTELVESGPSEARRSPLRNRYLSTGITVGVGAVLLLSGGSATLWPLFGAANQLLAALGLLAVAAWLSRTNQRSWYVVAPMFFMFAATLSALGWMAWGEFNAAANAAAAAQHIVRAIVALALMGLGLVLLIQALLVLRRPLTDADDALATGSLATEA